MNTTVFVIGIVLAFILVSGVVLVFVLTRTRLSEGRILAKSQRHYEQMFLLDTTGHMQYFPKDDEWVLKLLAPDGQRGEILVTREQWESLSVGDYYKNS